MALLITTRVRAVNLLLCVVAGALGLAVMWIEGYLRDVDGWFGLFGALIFVGALPPSFLWLSTKRWLALFGTAGTMGLITQYVGVSVNAWHYTNTRGTWAFVFFCFGFGAIFNYGVVAWLTNRVLPRHWGSPRATLILAALLGAAALLANGTRAHSPAFVAYYAAVLAFAALFAGLARTGTMVALVLASWSFGACAEVLGSHSGLWTFASGGLPPVWLVLASWPLEGILHFGLSALLVRERPDAPVLRDHERVLFALRPDHPLAVRPDNARVAVRRGGDDRLALLQQVIDTSGFLHHLEKNFIASGRRREDFLVAVKPNFMFMYSRADHSTYTDPVMVEYLVDRMVERGFTRVVVVEAQSAYGNEFEHRDVLSVARHVGYGARNYTVADLTLEQEPHVYPQPLGAHTVGRTWRDADYRVSFAKNKTHSWALYTLTIKNVYGALPKQDKLLEYHDRREIYAPTIASLIDFPVHFGFIDAFTSADGPFGIFADRMPVQTRTVIGGEGLLAVDWVGASMMGVAPMHSRYMQLAVQAFGKPVPVVDGDVTPYCPWRNVPDTLMNAVDAGEELYGFTDLVFALFNRMDGEFPRRRHGILFRLARAALRPLRDHLMVTPLGLEGQPDRKLR